MSEIAVTSSTSATVQEDVACLGCGYNLRTLRAAGFCPECGAAVAASLRQGPFANAPARWMRMVAVGLALMIVSFVPAIVGVLGWFRQDREVCFLEMGMAGPKLWILLREIQVTYPVAVTIANSISLVLQLMGVFALTWPTANQGSKARRMGVALRALMVIALVYWLAFVFKWVPSSALVNEVRSAALSWVMVLDVSCIALSGLIMGSISRRGGYRRVAIFIELAALVQAGGAALLFAGIYLLRRLEQPYIWTSLLTHAAGGVALTITGMWLMIKLLRGSQKVRAVVQVVDEKTHGH